MKTTIQVAILSNGHSIDFFPGDGKPPVVGSMWATQWGPREVVSIETQTLDTTPTEPHYC